MNLMKRLKNIPLVNKITNIFMPRGIFADTFNSQYFMEAKGKRVNASLQKNVLAFIWFNLFLISFGLKYTSDNAIVWNFGFKINQLQQIFNTNFQKPLPSIREWIISK